MKTKFLPNPVLMEKAIDALIDKLGISKASEFWVSLGYGNKDYTQIRKKLFLGETIETLYNKVKQMEKKK